MLLPIIMICVCALLGGGTLIFLKLSAKHKKSKNKDKEELAQITANEFVNVKDIRGNFLYTRDNLALAYLKMYPVASMDKPFSAPQGRAMAQGFFPFVYMLGSLLLMLPTGIVALVMLLTGAEGGIWLAIIPVALANGIGILALGTWLGGKLMDARMLSIVATLDSFASLQK